MSDREQKPKGKDLKGAGSKDAKLQKRNKNVTSDLPDRQKEAKLEAEVRREMAESGETIFEPWQLRVIELQAAGWSFERIIREGEKERDRMGTRHKGFREVSLPGRATLYTALNDLPNLREACEKAFRFAVDSQAQETIELANSLDQRKGLRPYEWVQARDKKIGRRLQVAARLHPDKWGDLATSEREVIVFEPYGGWVPTNLAKGAPGQGPEAEAAAERWKKMREEGEAVKGGGNG